MPEEVKRRTRRVMSTYDETKHRRGANPANVGQYSPKDHAEPDGVELGDHMETPQPMTRTVGVAWSEYGVIPKGKRSPYDVRHHENVDFPIRTVSSSDAPPAIGTCHFFDGHFYRPSAITLDDFDPDELDDHLAKADRRGLVTVDREAARQAAIDEVAEELSTYISIDGSIYQACGEPHYVVGGSGSYIDVSYMTPEHADESVFRADQADAALQATRSGVWPDDTPRLDVHDPSVLGTEVKPVIDLGYSTPRFWFGLSPSEAERAARDVLTAVSRNAPRTSQRIDFRALTYDQTEDYKEAMKVLTLAGVPLVLAKE
jgi:hypothetical protein